MQRPLRVESDCPWYCLFFFFFECLLARLLLLLLLPFPVFPTKRQTTQLLHFHTQTSEEEPCSIQPRNTPFFFIFNSFHSSTKKTRKPWTFSRMPMSPGTLTPVQSKSERRAERMRSRPRTRSSNVRSVASRRPSTSALDVSVKHAHSSARNNINWTRPVLASDPGLTLWAGISTVNTT